MRLVYVDEAGLSAPTQEPFLVVSGVIVHADTQLIAIENHLRRIVARHIPAKHQDGFIFHATELFNGGGQLFKRQRADFVGPVEWSLERRLTIADELARIPARFNLAIAMGFLDRKRFAEEAKLPKEMGIGQQTVIAHSFAYATCSMMVEQWMRESTQNEICMLIVEDNEQARSFIREVLNWHQDGKLVALTDVSTSMHFPLRKIKEDPAFQPKKPSHPLVVADFCAYVFKKILMGDERYNRFFDPMRQKIISFDEQLLLQKQKRRARRSMRRMT
jgi:hypothetical protein